MRRTLATVAITIVASMMLIAPAAPAAGVGRIASLEATIDTGLWDPPSPDPMGIAWWADRGRLIVVDSEVEESVGGITHFQGVNTWQITTDGTVQATSTTLGFSDEPTDVAAEGDTVYFVDDSVDRLVIVDVGADGDVGTLDDSVSSVSTTVFGIQDAEGLAAIDGVLFVSDGIKNQVYRIDPGSNGAFDGTDDPVSCFDTYALGMRDPEGVTLAANPTTGNLFYASRSDRQIAESTMSGELVDLIDVNGVLPPTSTSEVDPSGIAVAPASSGGGDSLYVTDRGVDNNDDPDATDGRIYEIGLATPMLDLAPVVASPGRQAVVEGEPINLQIVAADPNDDPLTYSATGLPPGLSIDPATGLITGTIASGASGGGFTTYASSIGVSDGAAPHAFRTVNWDVRNGSIANNAPSITTPGDQMSPEGAAVSLQVLASDPDAANALMYSATGLPPGLWMDCRTGVISGTIEPEATSGSAYTVRVSVSDQLNPSVDGFPSKWDAETFTWTIDEEPPAGIVFRAAASAPASSARSFSLSRPDGVQQGDLMLTAITFVGSPHSVRPPDGWALLQRDRVLLGLQSQHVYWKVAGATEPASYAWRSSSCLGASSVLVAYGGVDPSLPFVSHEGAAHLVPSRWIAAPSATASTFGEVLVGFFGIMANATITPAVQMQERTEQTSPGLLRVTIEAADETLAAAGPTGIRRAASSRAGINIGQVIVLRPAP